MEFDRFFRRLASRMDRLAKHAESWPLLAIFSASYLAIACTLASQKLIWDDEFFSLYISRGGPSEIHAALLTGADQHPPFFYWLTHLALSAFGEGHVALRLPAIVGVWLACVSLFYLVGRRTSRWFGLAAGLVVVNASSFYYATEARGYGPVLGFCGLALLCWQRATEGRHRTLCLLGLAAALMAAVSSHYYALALVGPLLLAEGARAFRNRRFDLPVLLAILAAGVPLLIFHDVLGSAQTYSVHFWATPTWRGPLRLYAGLMYYSFLPALLLAVLSFDYFHGGGTIPAQRERAAPPVHEIAVAFGLLVLPLVLVLAAKLFDKGFHQRYALSAEIGWAILIVFGVAWLCRGSRVIGMLLCLSLSLTALARSAQVFVGSLESQERLRETMILLDLQHPRSLPIVGAEVTPMHQISFYGPERLAERTYYLSRPDAAIRFLEHDTIDSGLLDLRPWFEPVQAVRYEDFLDHNHEFLTYGYVGRWSWLTFQLALEKNLVTELVGRQRGRLLLHSRHAETREVRYDAGSPRIVYGESAPESPFERADWTTSYCTRWMGDSICSFDD